MRNTGSLPGVVLRVRVTPRASRERIGRLADGGVRAYVTTPPEKGRANARLTALLAELLRVPRGSIEIVSGTSNTRKLVRVANISEAEVKERIPPLPSGHFMDAAGRRRRARRLAAKRRVRAVGAGPGS